MAKALVFFAPGLEECEGLLCVDILRRAGVEVTIAAVGGSKAVTSARGITVVADTLTEEVLTDAYDACVLPGGIPGVDNLKADTVVRRIVQDFAAKGKCIAAICAALGLTGLAGGAAVAGCCAQMIGFAVMSYKENGVGGLVSQGLGTSMLQMGNIVKTPRIWIAPTLASAITGPLATCLFHFEMNGAAVSSGMGTCGLVGQIGVYTGWVSDIAAGTKAAITPMDWAAMALLCFVLPAVLSVVFCEVERKLGWIKEGDLKLN